MPVHNSTRDTQISLPAFVATSFTARLIGMTGRTEIDFALLLPSCASIHTFGMKTAIDAIFLDCQFRVVRIYSTLKPNRMTRMVRGASQVLECPAGCAEQAGIRCGDVLSVKVDSEFRPDVSILRHIFHWPLNFFLAILWSRFVLLSLERLLETGTPLGTGILLHNTLLFLLFLTRRESRETTRRWQDWVIPFFTVSSAMFLRPPAETNPDYQWISIGIQLIGIAMILYSLSSLGRSFGVIPANRQIKDKGAYRLVRHPLYSSELVFYAGFLLGNCSLRNSLIVAFILGGQIWRSIAEERLLSRDEHYQNYLKKVRYRFLPGIY